MWNRYLQQSQQQRMWNARLQQQQQMWNAHLQRQQQQQRQQQEQEQLLQLEREMADRRLLSFLETDNSFLTPWNWNPDAPSTSRPMKIERGGSLFSHNLDFSSEGQITEYLSATYGGEQALNASLEQNLPRTDVGTEHEKSEDLSGTNLVFPSEDQISEDLSATYGKQDSSDKKDMEQVPNALLDQNLPRTNVGTEHEKSEDLSGTNAFVSDNSTDQIYVHSSDKKPKGTSVEQVSSEFNVDQIAEQASNALSDQNLPRTYVETDYCTTTSSKPEIPKPPRNEHTGKSMAEEKKQPKFSKIKQLRPQGEGSQGLNLLVKVVDTKVIKQRVRRGQMRFAQSFVGDETGMIIFNARNNQVDLMKEGATLILYNAKIEMFKGSMRLAVDKWGRIEVTEPATFSVKEDSNLSLIEFTKIASYYLWN